MRNPVNLVVGRVVDRLDKKERDGATPPELTGRATRSWYLRGVRLFASFSPDRIDQLGQAAGMRELARRENWLTDDDANFVYVVAKGGVKLCRHSSSGRRLVEGILGLGDVFGSLAREAGPTYLVEALEPTVLLSLPREGLLELLAQSPDACLRVVQVFDRQQRELSMRLESLVFKDVPTRVVEALLALSREHGDPCPHGFAVDVRVNQQDIADLVGASRQMVNRVIRDLTLKFYVKRKGKVLCILNRERLERLAEGLA